MEQGVAEGMLDNPGEPDSPVAQAIIRRILLQRTDLLAKHGPEKVGQAVDEVADFVGDVDEIGSSDVSGWVRHVEQMLGNMPEGVAEGLLGSDPNRGQKVPNWAKRGVVGKIGRKLDSAWSDVQRTVPQHLVSKQSNVPATNAPATKEMPKASSVIPARAIPQSTVTKPSQSVKKNVVKTIADKQGVEEGNMLNKIKAPAAPSSPALAAPRAPAVAETLRQIDRMLESVNSKKSAEIVKAYADQQFAKLGLHNTTECKQVMAHVVHESAVRRRAYAQRMAK
jgi:hypothetical protein